jgi:hypothetical protein
VRKEKLLKWLAHSSKNGGLDLLKITVKGRGDIELGDLETFVKESREKFPYAASDNEAVVRNLVDPKYREQPK